MNRAVCLVGLLAIFLWPPGVLGQSAKLLDDLERFKQLGVFGCYVVAEPLLNLSRGIVEKAPVPDHPSVATSLYNLASLYNCHDQYPETAQTGSKGGTAR